MNFSNLYMLFEMSCFSPTPPPKSLDIGLHLLLYHLASGFFLFMTPEGRISVAVKPFL